jgi:hypothetical protein
MSRVSYVIATKTFQRRLISLLSLGFAILLFQACKKNPPGTPGSTGVTGATALLTKVTLSGSNAANNTVESATTLIDYDANDNFTQTQFTDTANDLDITFITNEITTFTYGASLISSLTEAITTQTSVLGQTPYGTNDSTYITFYGSGGQVTYFTSINRISTVGVPYPTSLTTLDSSLVTYDQNGYISTYTVYEEDTVPGAYHLFYKQTFTYNGKNLAGYSLVNYATPNQSTTTATYTYNNHFSASPFYSIIPGIFIQSQNDISELSLTQTGVNAGNTIYSYSTTYNSSNQPTLSSVVISMTPTNASIPVAETIHYYYQH